MTVLTGAVAAAPSAHAAPRRVSPAVVLAAVPIAQPVQYYEEGRHREWRRREAYERFRRHEEWRRHRAWENRHGW